jgi:tripartite-type tricarboxylate transporter receptor subunit TctC
MEPTTPLGDRFSSMWQKQIGQSLVFEHRPGTGGTLGMAQVAKAAEAGPIAV